MEERIKARYRNSGEGAGADVTTHEGGDAPVRAYHNIFRDANTHKHGSDNPGEGDIHGKPRSHFTLVGSAGE
jgi:hypothetical protein